MAATILGLKVGRSEWEKLALLVEGPRGGGFTLNRQDVEFTKHLRVTVVVVDQAIVAAGLCRTSGRSSTLDTRLSVRDVLTVDPPIMFDDLEAHVHPRVWPAAQTALNDNRPVTGRANEEILAAIVTLNPEFREHLDKLEEKRVRIPPRSVITRLLAEQRDATALGLEMAGLDSSLVPEASADDTETLPFLRSMGLKGTSEASIVRSDFLNFDGWELKQGRIHDQIDFIDPADDSRRVSVLYADREDLEFVTGTDLIYYRHHHPGYILVQYKRMKKSDSRKTGEKWVYRPDSQLDREIQRMKSVQIAPHAPTGPNEWRLSTESWYVKLVEDGKIRPSGEKLSRGMYIPLSLLELLLGSSSTDGANGGKTLGWHNVPIRLNNSNFLELVKSGLIGSTGADTTTLADLINQTLEMGRGAIVVRDEGKTV